MQQRNLIDLDIPLDMQVEKIQQIVQMPKLPLIGIRKPFPGRLKMPLLEDYLIKALMKHFQINEYFEGNEQGEPLTRTPKFTYTEVTKTESDFLSRNWNKLTLGVVTVSAIGAGLSGGTGAAIAFTLSMVGSYFVYNTQRKNEQAILIREQEFINYYESREVGELATEIKLKAEIKNILQPIKEVVPTFKKKKDDLNFIEHYISEENRKLLQKPQVEDFNLDERVNGFYAAFIGWRPYSKEELDLTTFVKKGINEQYSEEKLAEVNALYKRIKIEAVSHYINNVFDTMQAKVIATGDLAKDQKREFYQSIKAKRAELLGKVEAWVLEEKSCSDILLKTVDPDCLNQFTAILTAIINDDSVTEQLKELINSQLAEVVIADNVLKRDRIEGQYQMHVGFEANFFKGDRKKKIEEVREKAIVAAYADEFEEVSYEEQVLKK